MCWVGGWTADGQIFEVVPTSHLTLASIPCNLPMTHRVRNVPACPQGGWWGHGVTSSPLLAPLTPADWPLHPNRARSGGAMRLWFAPKVSASLCNFCNLCHLLSFCSLFRCYYIFFQVSICQVHTPSNFWCIFLRAFMPFCMFCYFFVFVWVFVISPFFTPSNHVFQSLWLANKYFQGPATYLMNEVTEAKQKSHFNQMSVLCQQTTEWAIVKSSWGWPKVRTFGACPQCSACLPVLASLPSWPFHSCPIGFNPSCYSVVCVICESLFWTLKFHFLKIAHQQNVVAGHPNKTNHQLHLVLYPMIGIFTFHIFCNQPALSKSLKLWFFLRLKKKPWKLQ